MVSDLLQCIVNVLSQCLFKRHIVYQTNLTCFSILEFLSSRLSYPSLKHGLKKPHFYFNIAANL